MANSSRDEGMDEWEEGDEKEDGEEAEEEGEEKADAGWRRRRRWMMWRSGTEL